MQRPVGVLDAAQRGLPGVRRSGASRTSHKEHSNGAGEAEHGGRWVGRRLCGIKPSLSRRIASGSTSAPLSAVRAEAHAIRGSIPSGYLREPLIVAQLSPAKRQCAAKQGWLPGGPSHSGSASWLQARVLSIGPAHARNGRVDQPGRTMPDAGMFHLPAAAPAQRPPAAAAAPPAAPPRTARSPLQRSDPQALLLHPVRGSGEDAADDALQADGRRASHCGMRTGMRTARDCAPGRAISPLPMLFALRAPRRGRCWTLISSSTSRPRCSPQTVSAARLSVDQCRPAVEPRRLAARCSQASMVRQSSTSSFLADTAFDELLWDMRLTFDQLLKKQEACKAVRRAGLVQRAATRPPARSL